MDAEEIIEKHGAWQKKGKWYGTYCRIGPPPMDVRAPESTRERNRSTSNLAQVLLQELVLL
jgi:hypothetical protein